MSLKEKFQNIFRKNKSKIEYLHPNAPGKLPYLGIRYQIHYHTCNLDCPYCIIKWKTNENAFNFQTFHDILGKIRELPYEVCLRLGIGGEVFTSDAILDEIKKICNEENNIFGINFSSNIYSDWEKVIHPFLDSINTNKLGMGCTLHDLVIDDIDLFFEKVEKIKKAGVLLYVGYVAIPQMIKRLPEYKKRCEDIGVPLILNGLIGKLTGVEGVDPDKRYPKDYTREELVILKDLWYTPHSYQMLVYASSSEGMECSAGRNYIIINSSGEVSPCRNIKETMGNILNNQIKFKENDTICPLQKCWCGNENQALRIVDKYYIRTRNLRVFYPKKGISKEKLYKEYNNSIFKKNRD